MQILLPWQPPVLTPWVEREIHPEAPRHRVPSPYHDCLEVTLATESPGAPDDDGPFARVEQSVLAYRVFGPAIGEPLLEGTPVQPGDTIGLVYRFLPLLRLFFASRVTEVFVRQPYEGGVRSGFAYQTLEGHPELGEEVFTVSKNAQGTITFRIEAWSRPNLWFVKLLTPWARRQQKAAARSAGGHLAQVAGSVASSIFDWRSKDSTFQ